MTSRKLGGGGGGSALSTELCELMESKVIQQSSYVTGLLHTTRISTVKVIVSVINE